MPPLRKIPTGTSLTSCRATAPSRASRTAAAASREQLRLRGAAGAESPGDGRCLARPLGLSILRARASCWAAASAAWPGRFRLLAAIPGSGRVPGRTSRRVLRKRAPRTGIGGVVDHGARRHLAGRPGACRAASRRRRCRWSSSRRRHWPLRPTVACGTGSSRRSPRNRPRSGGARPLGTSRKCSGGHGSADATCSSRVALPCV